MERAIPVPERPRVRRGSVTYVVVAGPTRVREYDDWYAAEAAASVLRERGRPCQLQRWVMIGDAT